MPFLYRPSGTLQPGLDHPHAVPGAPALDGGLPEDLEFVRHVYETLYPKDPDFGTEAIAALDWNSSRAKG
jgi:hypothetical protein